MLLEFVEAEVRTLVVAAPAGAEMMGGSDLVRLLSRRGFRVILVRRDPSEKPTAGELDAGTEVVVGAPLTVGWEVRRLGWLESALSCLNRLATAIVIRNGGLSGGRVLRRLRLQSRLSALRVRRLETAASVAVEELFDRTEPHLLISLRSHENEEFPLLGAAYRRRTPVLGVVDGTRAVKGVRMPAARFARVAVADRWQAELVVRRGAHPVEVTILGRPNGPDFCDGLVDLILDLVGAERRSRSRDRRGRPTRKGDRRARVLMVGPERLPIPPARGGAVELYVHEVSRRLVDEFDIATSSPGPVRDAGEGVERRTLDAGDGYLPALLRLLERERYDLVHVFNRPWFVAAVAEVIGDARLVLGLHNDHLANEPPSEGAAAVALVDAIVCNSHFIRDRVLDFYPSAAGQVAVIQSGVDVVAFDPLARRSPAAKALRADYGITEDDPLLVYVGRIVPEKGAHLLPTILALVRQHHPNAKLLVVGSSWFGQTTTDDPYVKRVQQDAQAAGASIYFTGYLPYAEIPRVLSAADTMVATSQEIEAFGRFALEAMAAGVPLVTSPRGGTIEAAIDERTALVVENYTRPEAYADAICRLLSNSALGQYLARNGRQLVERRFTWNRVAHDFKHLYTTLLS